MEISRRMFLHLSAGTAASFLMDGVDAQDPKGWPDDPFLKGNFAPVHEEGNWNDLKIVGAIPEELNGLFVRNGPNPQFPPRGPYHWFDGDGMLHGLWLRQGKARYANRYVVTGGLLKERKAGRSLFGGFRSGPPLKNAANTAVVRHHGKLLALWEGGLPHEIDPQTLATIGEYRFGRGLKSAFTAHPKIDPETGELFYIGVHPFGKPFLTYGEVDPKGAVTHTTALEYGRTVLVHDFAVTAKHAILPDLPLYLSMMSGLSYNPNAVARLGILPRKGKGEEIRWVTIENCWMWHVLNAHETEKEIVLTGVRWDHGEKPKATPLHRWEIPLRGGAVRETRLDDTDVEFPRINETRTGREVRYGYAGIAEEDEFTGFLKYDLARGTSERHEFGRGRFGGEPVFVPRPGSTAEDDGWVVGLVYDSAEAKSELLIVAAQDFKGKPVAKVMLPKRVPYGFHGAWAEGIS